MRLDEILTVADVAYDVGIREIQVSGGEPFLSPYLIPLVAHLRKYADIEIGCATNASLVTSKLVKTLQEANVALNVNIPSANSSRYHAITGGGDLSTVKDHLKWLIREGVHISINCVMAPDRRKDYLSAIDLATDMRLKIKIIPQLFSDVQSILEEMHWFERYMDFHASNSLPSTSQRKRWTKSDGMFEIEVQLVDHPCIQGNCSLCRDYGEIRLLPDGVLMPCILKRDRQYPLKIGSGGISADNVRKTLESSWIDFTQS